MPGLRMAELQAPATHRAPKGRLREQEYWRFCLEHVREYNHAYNFFAGMSTDDIARYQKEAIIGHRPTWKMGMNGGPAGRTFPFVSRPSGFAGADDPFGLFRELGGRQRAAGTERRAPKSRGCAMPSARRSMRSASRRMPRRKTSRPRFKALVKRHHPDANGGDRSSEDRLREIIQAYTLSQVDRLPLSREAARRCIAFTACAACRLSRSPREGSTGAVNRSSRRSNQARTRRVVICWRAALTLERSILT